MGESSFTIRRNFLMVAFLTADHSIFKAISGPLNLSKKHQEEGGSEKPGPNLVLTHVYRFGT